MKTATARHVLLPILSSLATAAAAAPEGPSALDWPTDAGRCVTASFCEFRPDHFHSGIDISTWGKTGYRCVAVADGEIRRARISCGGYGRAVYLELRDGRTVVYAHLSRFTGALEDSARAIRERTGSAYFDREFAPGTLPMQRGELLGFTGQSGVGVPHLHVEIRDVHERPLDPLRAGLPVADAIAPSVTRIALTPLTPLSSVDGRSDTVILDVHPGEDADRIPRTLPVEGEIGVSVEVDETTDACRFRLAPARLELRDGDRLLYHVDYRGFAFSETGSMDQQIDPRFSYANVGRFHHLYRRAGNDLSFVGSEGGADGVLRALQVSDRRLTIGVDETTPPVRELARRSSVQREGERVRNVTVVAEDAAGNLSRATLSLSFAAPPGIRVLWARLAPAPEDSLDATGRLALETAWDDTLEVRGAIARGGRAIDAVELEWSPDGGATWFDAARIVPSADDGFEARVALGHRVPGTGRGALLVRARALDVLGATGIARSTAVEGAAVPDARPVPHEVVSMGGWAEVRFAERVPWQAVSGGWEPTRAASGSAAGEPADSLTAVLVRPHGRGIRMILPARPVASGRRVWSGLGSEWAGIDPWGRPVAVEFDVPPTFTPGDRDLAVEDGRGLARVTLTPGSFREPCTLRLREEPAPLAAAGELRPLGPLFLLDSGSVPPADTWTIRLRPAAETPDSARVGVFVRERDRFRYIGGERSADGSWSAQTRTLLGVGLFEDRKAPALGVPRVEERFGQRRLLFLAEDLGAGIDCDAIEVYLAGEPIAHELDDETGDVVAYPGAGIPAGAEVRCELRATDRCGNVARRLETVRFP